MINFIFMLINVHNISNKLKFAEIISLRKSYFLKSILLK